MRNYTVILMLAWGLYGCGGSSSSPQEEPLSPFVTGQAASYVIGAPDFTTEDHEGETGVSGQTFNAEVYGAVRVVNNVLYVPDYENDRVLGFNDFPDENLPTASFVLGQADFTSNASGNGASEMDGAFVIADDSTQFFILDYDNYRVLVYSNPPVAGPGTANFVIGQDDFGESVPNECDQKSLRGMEGIYAAGNKLVVSDRDNNRLLIWNLPITQNGQNADLVLGQNSFTTCVENDDNQDGSSDSSPSARTMSSLAGVWTDGNRLVVADDGNNRVLVWNTFPTTNFQPADIVLGQSNFTNNTDNDDNQDGSPDSAPSARTLSSPYEAVHSNGTELCIGDYDNSRVLIWNEFPTTNFQPADVVLGQQAMNLGTENDGDGDGDADDSPSATTINYPTGCYFYDGKLVVTDYYMGRYLIYERP